MLGLGSAACEDAAVVLALRPRALADVARGARRGRHPVAEAPWSEAEWAVALRFDNPRATVLVLVLG